LKNKITIKTIYQLVLDKKPALIWGQILTLLAIFVSVPIPLMLPVMVDEVLLGKPGFIVESIDSLVGETTPLYYILIVTLCVVLLRFIYYFFTVILTKIFTKISKYVTFEIRKKILKHLEKVSMNEYETLGSGAVSATLVTDVNTLDGFIASGVSKLISSVLTLIVIAFVMIAIDPLLGVLILVIQPIIMLLSKKMTKIVGRLKQDENAAIAHFQEEVGETLELFGQIKASNQESFFFLRAQELANKIQQTSNAYSYKNVAYERLSYTIFLVMFEVLRASGLLLVAYSDLSIGMMFAMFGYIWFIMTPVQDLLTFQYSYSSAMGAIERINKVLALHTEVSGTKQLHHKSLEIELQNVSFSYDGVKNILENISLTLPPKSKVALIGSSGSGKTTLAQIISGFYEKSSGEILYNGMKTQDLDKKSLREDLFLVLQMPILFNATLRFNITMGKKVSDTQILQALEVAQLSEMIEKMPEGLETIVGHHGIRLSGGQRQRLSIARMIIANPSVVIFDESTSALDVYTEAKLQIALEPILKEKTLITIAHRLSTVKNADSIYVLEDGKIIQHGTHEELEDEEGHYREFVQRQLL
jgi:ATP-binding cassette subfamily C protein